MVRVHARQHATKTIKSVHKISCAFQLCCFELKYKVSTPSKSDTCCIIIHNLKINSIYCVITYIHFKTYTLPFLVTSKDRLKFAKNITIKSPPPPPPPPLLYDTRTTKQIEHTEHIQNHFRSLVKTSTTIFTVVFSVTENTRQ